MFEKRNYIYRTHSSLSCLYFPHPYNLVVSCGSYRVRIFKELGGDSFLAREKLIPCHGKASSDIVSLLKLNETIFLYSNFGRTNRGEFLYIRGYNVSKGVWQDEPFTHEKLFQFGVFRKHRHFSLLERLDDDRFVSCVGERMKKQGSGYDNYYTPYVRKVVIRIVSYSLRKTLAPQTLQVIDFDKCFPRSFAIHRHYTRMKKSIIHPNSLYFMTFRSICEIILFDFEKQKVLSSTRGEKIRERRKIEYGQGLQDFVVFIRHQKEYLLWLTSRSKIFFITDSEFKKLTVFRVDMISLNSMGNCCSFSLFNPFRTLSENSNFVFLGGYKGGIFKIPLNSFFTDTNTSLDLKSPELRTKGEDLKFNKLYSSELDVTRIIGNWGTIQSKICGLNWEISADGSGEIKILCSRNNRVEVRSFEVILRRSDQHRKVDLEMLKTDVSERNQFIQEILVEEYGTRIRLRNNDNLMTFKSFLRM